MATATSIRLQWQDNSNNEQGFVLQRETQVSSTSWGNQVSFDIPANQTTYTDSPAVGLYRYRIRAYNTAGTSLFTNWTTAQFTPQPEAPTNFVVQNIGDGSSVQMNWTDNSSIETVFHLVWDKQVNGSWVRQPVISIPANSTSYVHVPGAGTHRYSIRSAYSVNGYAYKSALTPWQTVVVQIEFFPPLAPTNFIVTLKMDQMTVDFFWQDNSTNETIFHLVPQKLIGTTWTTLNYIRIPANNTSYSYKPGNGDWRFAIRSAYSVNGYAYKSALTPWVQLHVPLSPHSA